MIDTRPKSKFKTYLAYGLQSIMEENKGKNSKSKLEAKKKNNPGMMPIVCSQAFLPRLTFNYLSYYPGPLPRDGTVHIWPGLSYTN